MLGVRPGTIFDTHDNNGISSSTIASISESSEITKRVFEVMRFLILRSTLISKHCLIINRIARYANAMSVLQPTAIVAITEAAVMNDR